MNTAIEGRQVPINAATKAELKAFAAELGCVVTNFDTEDRLRARIKGSGYEEAHIVVGDASPKGASKPVTNRAQATPGVHKIVKEPMVSLTIHPQEGSGGKRHVFVGVNGKAMLIPRGKPCEVKLRYLGALENAVETKYEFDEDVKANVPRDMPSYPFQVHRMPSQVEIDAWRAFEAAEEAAEAAVKKAEAASKRAAA